MTTLTTLWLVREGGWPKACPLADPTDCNGEHCDCPLSPPVEFVQASAPCETCKDERAVFCPDCGERGARECVGDGKPHVDCPDCRIELVGGCPNLGGSHPVRSLGWEAHCGPVAAWGNCHLCNSGTVTLGHAYAVGSPLPIVGDTLGIGDYLIVDPDGDVWALIDEVDDYDATDLTDRLAHCGPPETLVGKWALQLAVVGS